MARRYSRGAWKLLEKKKEREEGCKKGGKGKRSRLTEIREKECTMSRIEGLPPCTLRVLSSERKDGGERHERKNWKLINGVSWHIRRRVKKKKKKRRRNTVEIWMLEGKRNFFFFFCAKRIHYCIHSPSLLLRIFLLLLLPCRDCSLLARIHDCREKKEERKLTSVVKRGGRWKELDRREKRLEKEEEGIRLFSLGDPE